jgi:Ras-related protein Rab-6A
MEDKDDNIGQLTLGEFEKEDDSFVVGSNIEQENNILEKGRITENLKSNETPLMNRFTIVEDKFSEEQNDIKEEFINNYKNNENSNVKNDSKNEYLIKKKQEYNSEESKINFINLKIILIGDIAVGKTSIISRYVNNSFEENYQCTIQAEQQTKIVKEDENTYVKLIIWDTVGQEKFRSLTRQYYNGCQGAIIVFDLTNKKSFDYIQNWIEEIKNYGDENAIVMIIGNKSDLTAEREISQSDIKNKLNGEYFYFEVSAKNGNNISMAFDKMKKLISEIRKEEEKKEIKEKDQKNKYKKEKKLEDKKSKSLNKYDKNFKEKNKKCC